MYMVKKKPKGYWNREKCYEEAKKFTSKSNFSRKSGYAYKLSLENNWLNDYDWFVENQKPVGYWGYEQCYNEAKKYKSRGEFAKYSQTAYQRARRKKWLKDYDWFIPASTPAGTWNYELCFREAKKYNSRTDFNRNSCYAYKVALKNGWLEDYTWFENKFKWTYESCLKIAKQFKTKREFEKGHKRAYEAALRHDWMKYFDWFVSNRVNILSDKIDCVYLYFFEDYNAVYIGRTINKRRRDREHIFAEQDAVAKFAQEHNISVPKMIILEDNITIAKGQEREDFWLNYYKEQGYYVLNKAKTGIGIGSLGSLVGQKWTKKTCFDEAKKYFSRKAFQRGNVGAYTRALQRGWLNDYTWFERPKNWNQVWDRETCYEEALKYKTLSSFRAICPTAYNKAMKNDWLKDYLWLPKISKTVGNWTYERCYDEAKKYTSRAEFKKNARTAYRHALTNNWLIDYTWFVKLWEHKWNKETCSKEAARYSTRSKFRKASGSAYAAALRNGWLDEFFPVEK